MARVLGSDDLGLGVGTYGIKEGSTSVELTTRRVKGRIWKDRKTFSVTYYVLAEDLTEDEADVSNATGIPPKFYPLRGCFCIAHHPKEVATVVHPVTGVLTTLWELTADFDSEADPDDDVAPEARVPKYRWQPESEEEVLERDVITGAPIQTEPGERIIISHPVVVPVLEITRWEFYPFDPNVMLFFANRSNSAPFWGAPAGTAVMLPMEVGEFEKIPVPGIELPVKYVPVTYRIKFKLRPDPASPSRLLQNPWKSRVLHEGWLVRPIAGAEPEKKLNAKGQHIKCNLNPDGTENTSGTPHFLEFNRHAFANFNALSLGPF